MQDKSLLSNLVKGINQRISKTFDNPYRDLNLGFFKLKYLKHLPAGVERQHEYKSGIIYYTNPQELLHGFEEIFIQEIYKISLKPNCCIIDCGANIGLSVIYLKQLFPNASIIAFEPDENNFTLLTKNVASFHLHGVDLRKEAVWIENTLIGFKNEGSMSSKVDHGSTGTIKVKASRLKDLLVQQIDFLKIDIEGAEYEVLKDIEESLFNVRNLFIEYHGSFEQNNELTHVFAILTKNGFNYYIKEATQVYKKPFFESSNQTIKRDWDIQLNIFCFRRNDN
jgi:FkbM family methyltransferase